MRAQPRNRNSSFLTCQNRVAGALPLFRPGSMMKRMSFSETIFLFFLALIIFGPKKLPEIARQIGKVLNEFRRASNEFKSQIEQEIANLEVENKKHAALPANPAPEGTTSRALNSAGTSAAQTEAASASTAAESTATSATLAASTEEPPASHALESASEPATEALPSTEHPATTSDSGSAADSIAAGHNSSRPHDSNNVTSPATQESHV
jgi:sec-independent protein translocase protein TatB